MWNRTAYPPIQVHTWAINNIPRSGTVCLMLPDTVFMSCPRGFTVSPLPELRPWACKGVFWQYYAECLWCERIPQSFSAIFAQPITSSLSAVPRPTHARMRYCYWIIAHILKAAHVLDNMKKHPNHADVCNNSDYSKLWYNCSRCNHPKKWLLLMETGVDCFAMDIYGNMLASDTAVLWAKFSMHETMGCWACLYRQPYFRIVWLRPSKANYHWMCYSTPTLSATSSPSLTE